MYAKMYVFYAKSVNTNRVVLYVKIQVHGGIPDLATANETGSKIYQLFWIFMIGCVAGDIIETIYCFFGTGTIMNRSSVLYGPFSIVWGAGAVLMSLFAMLLYSMNINVKSLRASVIIIAAGAVIGGMHEYFSSYLSEILFGSIHWDYSDMEYNFDGRTNLLFCVYWGIIALVWIRWLYPKVCSLIKTVPFKIGRILTIAATVFMVLNLYISGCSLARYTQRAHNIPAKSEYERFLDENYPDSLITSHFPDIKVVR